MSRRSQTSKSKKCLVLNADYTCMNLTSVRDGLEDYIKNMYYSDKGLIAIDYYDKKILSCGGRYFYYPSVLKTVRYIRPKGKRVPYSTRNLYVRDNMTCMYCGHFDPTAKTLTKDHVIPRAIWKRQNHNKSPTGWYNIVTACKKCNIKKANRTPKQAKMYPKWEPFEPNPHNHILGFSPWMRIEPEWFPYLPKNYKNLLDKMKEGV